MSSKAEAPANSERTTMTHVTIERANLEQVLEALEKHGVAPKDWACKECVPFSDILKDGFQCKYHKAITTCQQALAQPAVPLTDLGTLQAIVDEYYAWIRHHAAGHDYDDFLRNRIAHGITKGQP